MITCKLQVWVSEVATVLCTQLAKLLLPSPRLSSATCTSSLATYNMAARSQRQPHTPGSLEVQAYNLA